MGILRNSLLTSLIKLFISLGIRSGHLTLLNFQFIQDFLWLDPLASWLPIRFLPLLHAVIMQLSIFVIRDAFRSIHKDVLPIFQQSNLIYKFQCQCNATYIGRTSQCLVVRIKRHVPRDIHNYTTSRYSKLLNSAICEHLKALVVWLNTAMSVLWSCIELGRNSI